MVISLIVSGTNNRQGSSVFMPWGKENVDEEPFPSLKPFLPQLATVVTTPFGKSSTSDFR